ncbi:hypothetical protein RRG08_003576 [Elysia crispata]|uniref:Uncharacterized protein n=1 Tax=Elysia crispata TaxID=231223 RepID=A0AAE1CZM2_9GAST|nr:hypothetical protein RRG08_003576 [Elysia crispata]
MVPDLPALGKRNASEIVITPAWLGNNRILKSRERAPRKAPGKALNIACCCLIIEPANLAHDMVKLSGLLIPSLRVQQSLPRFPAVEQAHNSSCLKSAQQGLPESPKLMPAEERPWTGNIDLIEPGAELSLVWETQSPILNRTQSQVTEPFLSSASRLPRRHERRRCCPADPVRGVGRPGDKLIRSKVVPRHRHCRLKALNTHSILGGCTSRPGTDSHMPRPETRNKKLCMLCCTGFARKILTTAHANNTKDQQKICMNLHTKSNVSFSPLMGRACKEIDMHTATLDPITVEHFRVFGRTLYLGSSHSEFETETYPGALVMIKMVCHVPFPQVSTTFTRENKSRRRPAPGASSAQTSDQFYCSEEKKCSYWKVNNILFLMLLRGLYAFTLDTVVSAPVSDHAWTFGVDTTNDPHKEEKLNFWRKKPQPDGQNENYKKAKKLSTDGLGFEPRMLVPTDLSGRMSNSKSLGHGPFRST